MIGQWGEPNENFSPRNITFKRSVFTINGRAWPYTERLTYSAGQTVRWRWINASEPHSMHLHGFYYQIKSKGDAERDSIYKEDERRRVVTELMPIGSTMSVVWVPERAGNWLFHCHLLSHISPRHRHRPKPPVSDHESHSQVNHALEEMSGLVMGIHVLPSHHSGKAASLVGRRISLSSFRNSTGRFGKELGLGYVLQEGDSEPPPNVISIRGPPIVLTRGQPVRVKIINKLREPTSVHWHGIELESYFDGVPGWGSDSAGNITPPIIPGGSFVVEMTPPRAGTFIYHTHSHDERQLSSGLYGPLIVIEPGQTFDPATDRILLISLAGPAPDMPEKFLNGSAQPEPMELRIGTKYRFRVINITAENVNFNVHLLSGDSHVNWRAIAKDGRDLPPSQAVVKPASQTVTVGETYDFEYQPSEAGDLRFEVRSGRGAVPVAMSMRVR